MKEPPILPAEKIWYFYPVGSYSLYPELSTMTTYALGPIRETDGRDVVDIFNHYVEHSLAAFPEQKMPYEFFGRFMQACAGYPSVAIRCSDGTLGGFGVLRPHNPMKVFSRTAEITYFIRPDLTGLGLGTMMLDHLEAEGRKMGIRSILACIASGNEGSIRFHMRQGFAECGRFREVACKNGIVFDTVWMQKFI